MDERRTATYQNYLTRVDPNKIWRITARGVCSMTHDGTTHDLFRATQYLNSADWYMTQGEALAEYKRRVR